MTTAQFTPETPITVTRIQAVLQTGPSGCVSDAVFALTDGIDATLLTLDAAVNDTGPVSLNYAAGVPLTASVIEPFRRCTTAPADGNVVIQFKAR